MWDLKKVSGLALLLTTLAAGYILAPFPRSVEKLRYHDSTWFRDVVSATKEEGYSQIRKALRKTHLEDYWGFVPEENRWYELGVNSFFQTVEGICTSGTNTNLRLLNVLLSNNQDVRLVHYHPSERVIEYLKAQHLEYDPEVFPHPSFFSPNDLAVIIDSTVHHHLPLTVVHDVVSEEGIATFQITSQGVDYFTPMTPEEILVEVNRRLRPELNNFQCFDLEDLAMEINNKYFSFAFRRFSE